MGVKEIIGPDGDRIYEAKCNGTARTIGDCYAQAGETCRGEYTILNSSSDLNYMAISGNVTPLVSRQILFKCKQFVPEAH
jgi:hypothetical protein